jgi:hypothetical protein
MRFAALTAAYLAALVASMPLTGPLDALLILVIVFGISLAYGLSAARRLALLAPAIIASGLAAVWSTQEPWTDMSTTTAETLVIAGVFGVTMTLGVAAGLAGAMRMRGPTPATADAQKGDNPPSSGPSRTA